MGKELGISQEALDGLERTFFSKSLAELPSPMPAIPQEVLDAIPRKHLDLAYDSRHEQQKLDLYLPPEVEDGPVPVFVFIHGGGFAWCDKRDLTATPYMGVLNHGYALASVNYRLSDVAPYPAALHDAKAAIRWLRAHAGEYGLDAARFAVSGVSAGGWIALMVATTPNIAEMEDLSSGNSAYGTEVRCTVTAYPATDYSTIEEQSAADGIPMDGATIETTNRFLGRDIHSMTPAELRHVSPIDYITPQVPPILIQHGDDDHAVPFQQSETFAAEMARIAGPDKVAYKLVPGADHSDPAFKKLSWLEQYVAFLDKYMK